MYPIFMRSIISLILFFEFSIASSFPAHANCDDVRSVRNEVRELCNKEGGLSGPGSRESDECKAYIRVERYLQLCEKYHKHAASYYAEIAEIKKETAKLVAEKEKRDREKLAFETKITSIVNSYYSGLADTEVELRARLEALLQDFLDRGLDLDDPTVNLQLSEAAKVIEKDCTKNLLRRMLEQ